MLSAYFSKTAKIILTWLSKTEIMCAIDYSFFDKDFFQDLVSSLIGMGSALLIFYLTLKSDKNKEKRKNKEENKNRLRHFSNLTKSSQGHIEGIISNLDEMIASYGVNQLDFQLLKFAPNKSLNRLEKLLKNENYFLAYVEEFGEDQIKTFNNLSSEIDFFIMQIEQIWDMIKLSQKFDYDRKTLFKDQVTELMNVTAWITKQPNVLSNEDNEQLGVLIKDFYDNFTDGTDLEYFYAFVRNTLEKVLIKYTDNQVILELLPKFRNTSALFEEIKNQNLHHRDNLKQISEQLASSLAFFKRDTENIQQSDTQ